MASRSSAVEALAADRRRLARSSTSGAHRRPSRRVTGHRLRRTRWGSGARLRESARRSRRHGGEDRTRRADGHDRDSLGGNIEGESYSRRRARRVRGFRSGVRASGVRAPAGRAHAPLAVARCSHSDERYGLQFGRRPSTNSTFQRIRFVACGVMYTLQSAPTMTASAG